MRFLIGYMDVWNFTAIIRPYGHFQLVGKSYPCHFGYILFNNGTGFVQFNLQSHNSNSLCYLLYSTILSIL